MPRKLLREEIRMRLHNSVMKIVAEEGIKGLSTRKIASTCGLSEPYIYQCYDSITELLEAVFVQIDMEIAELLTAKIQQIPFNSSDKDKFEAACWQLWLEFWNYLMKDPNKTIFFWRFHQSGYHTEELEKKRTVYYSQWLSFLRDAIKRHNLDRHADIKLMILIMVDGTLMSVVRTLRSEPSFPSDSLTMQTIFRTLFAQLFSIFEAERQNNTLRLRCSEEASTQG